MQVIGRIAQPLANAVINNDGNERLHSMIKGEHIMMQRGYQDISMDQWPKAPFLHVPTVQGSTVALRCGVAAASRGAARVCRRTAGKAWHCRLEPPLKPIQMYPHLRLGLLVEIYPSQVSKFHARNLYLLLQ